MNTIALRGVDKTKKLIELPNDICRRLAVQAAVMGVSVKKLIENVVISAVEDADDDAVYAYLLQTRPEGQELMTPEEQSSLLDELRQKSLNQ